MPTVTLKQQEVQGNYRFNSQIYTTRGFLNEFGNNSVLVVTQTMRLIFKRINEEGADYFQIAEYSGTKYWIIDSVEYITFLLPEEY